MTDPLTLAVEALERMERCRAGLPERCATLVRETLAQIASLKSTQESRSGEYDIQRKLDALLVARLENWATEMDRSAAAMKDMGAFDVAAGNSRLAEPELLWMPMPRPPSPGGAGR